MKLFTLVAALGIVAGLPVWGQGVTPGGVIVGDGRDFRQDLTRPGAPPARPGTTPPANAQRNERQRQANQNFPGTGRPVAAPATPTPPAGAARTSPPAAAPAAAPARPSAPVRPQPEAAEPRATSAAPPPSTRAAPVTIQPGQSTGAARGTPASR